MKTLLIRVCPYCTDPNDFASNQTLLVHIHKKHQKVLPPRPKPMQNLPDEVPCTTRNRESNPEAPTKFGCPSCNMSFHDRASLKPHIEVDHVVFDEQKDQEYFPTPVDNISSSSSSAAVPSSSAVVSPSSATVPASRLLFNNWFINGVNVSESFRNFRTYCINNSRNLLDIDQHFLELL